MNPVRTVRARGLALALSFELLAVGPLHAGPPRERTSREVHEFLTGAGERLRVELAREVVGESLRSAAAVIYVARHSRKDGWTRAKRSTALRAAALEIVPLPRSHDDTSIEWHEAMQWDASFEKDVVRSTYRVGTDIVTFRFLRDAKASSEDLAAGSVEIEINGSIGQVDASAPSTVDFSDPSIGLHDAEGFLDAWTAFHGLSRGVQAATVGAVDPEKSSCGPKCIGCAGAILGSLGSTLGVVVACGGTIVTGGGTAALCVVAFVGHGAAMLGAFAACGVCDACIQESRGRSRKPKCCPCLGDPSCDCADVCSG